MNDVDNNKEKNSNNTYISDIDSNNVKTSIKTSLSSEIANKQIISAISDISYQLLKGKKPQDLSQTNKDNSFSITNENGNKINIEFQDEKNIFITSEDGNEYHIEAQGNGNIYITGTDSLFLNINGDTGKMTYYNDEVGFNMKKNKDGTTNYKITGDFDDDNKTDTITKIVDKDGNNLSYELNSKNGDRTLEFEGSDGQRYSQRLDVHKWETTQNKHDSVVELKGNVNNAQIIEHNGETQDKLKFKRYKDGTIKTVYKTDIDGDNKADTITTVIGKNGDKISKTVEGEIGYRTLKYEDENGNTYTIETDDFVNTDDLIKSTKKEDTKTTAINKEKEKEYKKTVVNNDKRKFGDEAYIFSTINGENGDSIVQITSQKTSQSRIRYFMNSSHHFDIFVNDDGELVYEQQDNTDAKEKDYIITKEDNNLTITRYENDKKYSELNTKIDKYGIIKTVYTGDINGDGKNDTVTYIDMPHKDKLLQIVYSKTGEKYNQIIKKHGVVTPKNLATAEISPSEASKMIENGYLGLLQHRINKWEKENKSDKDITRNETKEILKHDAEKVKTIITSNIKKEKDTAKKNQLENKKTNIKSALKKDAEKITNQSTHKYVKSTHEDLIKSHQTIDNIFSTLVNKIRNRE